ncbi:MAG: hypothetical protein JSS27_02050 [Planctomycetes bacterium]|nr:hypothetical protein [Planctomycetota bacterium]
MNDDTLQDDAGASLAEPAKVAARRAPTAQAVSLAWRGSAWYELAAVIALLLAALFLGCDSNGYETRHRTLNEEISEELFNNAFQLLNVLDDFETDDATQQVVDRLNQWLLAQPATKDWQVDPLVDSLPKAWRESGPMQGLNNQTFANEDGLVLQEAVWLREAARHAVDRETEPVARAERLFDWTIRNIALLENRSGETTKFDSVPWRTMLLGRGTAEERAWVFTLLARQQQLDVVVLSIGDPQELTKLRVWTAALAHEGELYLFDPRLGLPIRPRDGRGVMTLAQLRADRERLSALGIEGEAYPLAPADLDHVVALIEATPLYLSSRARIVEQRLAGAQRLELTVAPSVIAKQLPQSAGLIGVQLWTRPLAARRALAQVERAAASAELTPFREVPGKPLWHGRIRHLLGRYTGERGAIHYYIECRIAEEDLAAATQSQQLPPDKLAMYRRMKEQASYWLGLISWERDNFDSAIDYLLTRTLIATPKGPWTSAAHYNLGRVYETQGNNVEAAKQFRAATGPQHLGNLLRAQALGVAPAVQPTAAPGQ